MDTDKMETIVLAIDEQVEDNGWNQGHLLICVADEDEDGATIGTMAIDGHPLQTLEGLVAPENFVALGVCAEGWAASMNSGSRPSQSKGRMRVRQTVLVCREGNVASCMRLAGDEPKLMPEGEGPILDELKRALGIVSEKV